MRIETEYDEAVQAAVTAERERIRRVIATRMDTTEQNYRDGMDDTPLKRAYALGVMGALHGVSQQLGEGITPVYPHIADYQAACEQLGV